MKGVGTATSLHEGSGSVAPEFFVESNESDSEITYDHTDYYNDILDLPVLLRKSTGVSTMEAVDYI